MKFVEQHGDRGALHLMLVERLDGGEARGGAGPRAGGGTAHSFNSGWSPERRIDTERACAGSPSAVARAIAAGPIRASEVGSSARKLVRFMKSRTDRKSTRLNSSH